MRPFLFSLACSLSCCLALGDEDRSNSDFAVQAELLEALEGGPLVVKVTLHYQGAQARRVAQCPYLGNVNVDVSENWDFRVRACIRCGPTITVREIAPGDRWTETVFVHQHYSKITRGKVALKLSWEIWSRDGKTLIARPVTTLPVDVRSASADQLAALRRRLEEKVRGKALTEREQRDLANYLLETEHGDLVPVALQMIKSPNSHYPVGRLVRFAYDVSQATDALHASLVKLALDPNWEGAGELFDCWRGRKMTLPPLELQKLCQSDSVWTRAMTYAVFGKACDPAWADRLLRELYEPAPAARVAKLLRELDDDSFAVRERASAELEALGRPAEAQLRRAFEGGLSPEAARRVQRVLDRVSSQEASPECERAFGYLRSWNHFRDSNTPQTTAILEALARGAPESRMTQEAKAALERHTPREKGAGAVPVDR